MPLKRGKTRADFQANLRELAAANEDKDKPRSVKQMLAIAYAQQRGKKRD